MNQPNKQHGGAREGSGRKPKLLKYASEIAEAERTICESLPFLIQRLIALGEGVCVQKTTPDGQEVFEQPPDRQALQYLTERIMGKLMPTPDTRLVDDLELLWKRS